MQGQRKCVQARWYFHYEHNGSHARLHYSSEVRQRHFYSTSCSLQSFKLYSNTQLPCLNIWDKLLEVNQEFWENSTWSKKEYSLKVKLRTILKVTWNQLEKLNRTVFELAPSGKRTAVLQLSYRVNWNSMVVFSIFSAREILANVPVDWLTRCMPYSNYCFVFIHVEIL